METGGDLGRRIVERRHELGLSRAETAHLAGMDETYLTSLERSPSATPSRAALWRLASALSTTVEGLTGAGQLSPQGHGPPVRGTVLDEIDEATCRELVAPGGVGRVVYVDRDVPLALPVNFRTIDGDVVFRTTSASLLVVDPPDPVSFEVDHVDDALSEGWSVLMTGSVRQVADPAEQTRIDALGLEPWAQEDRDAYLKLSPRSTTGRRIRSR
jgi:transcriptional regulator with XRE-family HTH domain